LFKVSLKKSLTIRDKSAIVKYLTEVTGHLPSQVGLLPVVEEGEGVGGAGGDAVGHVGEGVPDTGRLLVPIPGAEVCAAPPAPVAAGQRQALVHPPPVVGQARLHSVHRVTLVTVVGGVVLLHVDV